MLALAGIETRKILLHPLFLGSMGVCALFITRAIGSNGNIAWLVAGLAVGVGVGGFFSINVAAQRARRDRVLELFGSLPAPAESRTGAVLLAGLFGPVVLASLVASIGGVALEADPKIAPGVDLFLLAQIPLTIAAFAALGVALARWIPSPVAAPVFLVAQVMTGAIWAINWVAPTSSGIRVGVHIAYLVAIIVFSSAVALVRDRRTPLRIVVAGLAITLVVVAADLQIPPGAVR